MQAVGNACHGFPAALMIGEFSMPQAASEPDRTAKLTRDPKLL